MERLVALPKNIPLFQSLGHHNYRLLWQGNLTTQTGQWMQQLAMGWLVLELTNSPVQIGLVALMRAAPTLGLGLFGGVLTDRLDKRKTLMQTQVAVMVIATTIALLIATDLVQVWHLYVFSLVQGILMTLNQPIRNSLVSELVPRQVVPNAVALNSVANNLSRVAGPALAGVLISTIGTSACFFIQALAFAVAVLNTTRIVVPVVSKQKADVRVLTDLVEGLRYIRASAPIFVIIVLSAIINFFGGPYQQLLPVFARNVLVVDASGLGVLTAAIGAGAVCGALAVAAFGRLGGKGKSVLVCMLGMGALLIGFASSQWFPLSAVVLFLVGACNSAANVSMNTLLQLLAPSHLRGRILSAYILTWGFLPLGTLPAGLIAEHFGAPLAVTIGGVVVIFSVISVAIMVPHFRRLA